MRTGLIKLTLVVGAIAILTGCTLSTGPRLGGGTVNVALLVPTESADARVNSLAATLISAANLAVSEMPEGRIQLTVYSTRGTVEGARAAATAAKAAKARIIVGPLYADNAAVVGQEVAGSGIPVFSFSNNPEIAGGNVYTLGQSFEDTAARLLAYARSQGRSRVLAIVPEGASGDVAANAVLRAANDTGVVYSGVSTYPFSQEGVQTSASSIVRDINQTGSDIAIISANPAGALPLLAQSLGEENLNTSRTLVMGLARWDLPTSTLSLITLQNGLFALPNIQAATDFSNRFQEFAGIPPQLVTSVSYDAMKVVTTQVLSGTSDAFSQARLTSTTFKGASGDFRLSASGQTRRSLAIAQVEDGSYSVVSRTQINDTGS